MGNELKLALKQFQIAIFEALVAVTYLEAARPKPSYGPMPPLRMIAAMNRLCEVRA
jgi:hypothetical protein